MRSRILSLAFIFSFVLGQNYSLSFDGVDDYVDLGIGFNLQDYTIEVRLKTNDTGEGAIISKSVGGNDGASSWRIWQVNGVIYTGINDVVIVGDFIADDNWRTVTTQNIGAESMYLHVDGVYLGGESGYYNSTSTQVNIGAQMNGPYFFNEMIIDEIRISNISRYGASDYNDNDDWQSDENTIALYNFNEGEGDILYDQSGNQNHGTIYGATWSTDVPTFGGSGGGDNCPLTLTVSNPPAGSTYDYPSTISINWSSTSSSGSDYYVNIKLYKGGSFQSNIDNGFWSNASGGTWDWYFPDNIETGSNYSIRVECTENNQLYGESGYFTINAQDFTAPSTPTNLTATPGDGEVVLTWTANSESDLASYKVYGDAYSSPNTLLATIAAGTETYTHSNLTNENTYYYRISAVDDSDNESDKTSDVSAVPVADYSSGVTLHVSTSGSDSNDGSSSSPYATIQAGINAATNADTVLVQAGTYTENLTFQSDKSITIASLYETTGDTSYISTTIVNGNGAAPVLYMSSSSASLRLVGLTLTNGGYDEDFTLAGGGLHASNSDSLFVDHVVIKNNATEGYGSSGGAYIYELSYVKVINTTISDNTCPDNGGGGLNVESCDEFELVNTLIEENTGNGYGAGVYISNNDEVQIVNSTIANNKNDCGGCTSGFYISSANTDSVLIMNSIISQNKYLDDNADEYRIAGSQMGFDGGKVVMLSNYTSSSFHVGESRIKRSIGNVFSSSSPFTDAANGDYSLSPFSGAIGSGIVSASYDGNTIVAPTTDLLSVSRPTPEGSTPDMGALESSYANKLTMIYVATTGSDANQGTEASPFLKVQHAIDIAGSGDTVLVAPGTYTENLAIERALSVTIGSQYLTTGDTSHISSTTLHGGGAGPTIYMNTWDNWAENYGRASLFLIGVTVTGGAADEDINLPCSPCTAGGGLYAHTIDSLVFDHVNVMSNTTAGEGSTGGIGIGGDSPVNSYVKIANSTISNNTANDYNIIFNVNNTKKFELINSIVHSNTGTGYGIGLNVTADTVLVLNSTIANNKNNNDGSTDGLYINMDNNSDSVLVMNSIISQNKYYDNNTDSYLLSNNQIGIQDGKLILINNYTNENLHVGQNNIKRESGNVYSEDDPFTDLENGDLSLSDISDAIGAGTSSNSYNGATVNAPVTDINGNSRPSPAGSTPDIGAIENARSIRAAKTITVNQDGSGDFSEIQTAIDAVMDGDTVLVAAGTYTENINYNGKNIVVGSLFLTTQDLSYISSTIIDGNQAGSVVTFENGEDLTAVLSGFTIQNGTAVAGYFDSGPFTGGAGGGILCNGASPILDNLIIRNNTATGAGRIGGGIFAIDGNISIQNCVVRNNSADGGGGVWIHGSSGSIKNSIIYENTTEGDPGASVKIASSGYTTSVINTVIYNNNKIGLSVVDGAGINIINSIIKNNISSNDSVEINIGSNATASVSYSMIPNELNAIYNDGNLIWGDGNIDSDPLFVDAANGDYRLSGHSPAIGAGTVTGAPTTDIAGNPRPSPSGSNPDIGAYENAQPNRRPLAGTITDGLGADVDWGNSTSTLSAAWDEFSDNSAVTYEYAVGIGEADASGENYSLEFDGNSAQVDLPSSLLAGVNQFTFETWFYPAGDQYGFSNIVHQEDGPYRFVIFYDENSSLFAIDFTINNYSQFLDLDIPSPNQWHHIAFAYNGSTATAYLDGEQVGSFSISGSYNSNSNIGIGNWGYQEGFNGNIDDLSFWNTANSQSEIQDHMASGLTGDEDGLMGYWDFNDASGTTLTDQSGNNNHGSIYEATWSDNVPESGGHDDHELADVLTWTSNGADTSVTITGLTLTNGETYTVSVRATDTDSQISDTTTTDGITIDTDAPVISEVIEGNVIPEEYNGVSSTWLSYTTDVVGEGVGTNSEAELIAAIRFGPDDLSNYDGMSLTKIQFIPQEPNAIYQMRVWTTDIDGEPELVDSTEYFSGNELNIGNYNIIDISTHHLLNTEKELWFGYKCISQSGYPLGADQGPVVSQGYSDMLYFEGSWQSINENYGLNKNWLLKGLIESSSSNLIDLDYQNSSDQLIISWYGSDEVSGISTYEYALGTTSGGTDAIDWTSTGTATADTLTGLSLVDGQIYYVSVRATDVAGNVSDVLTGDGITIDLTAPAGTTVNDGTEDDITYSGAESTLSANWNAFTDGASGVDNYEVSIGTSASGTDILDWTDNSTETTFTNSNLYLDNGNTYYMNVRATDVVGNVSAVISSDGVIADLEGPEAGATIDGTVSDVDWTNSTSALAATWSGFSDTLSGIQTYEYAIGTTSGGTDVIDWTDNSIETEVLMLTNGTTYYVSVRATDNVGNVSATATTDGITVDTDAPVISSVVEGATGSGNTLTDIDGNIYQTVQIGDQVWMAENLKVSKYRDGTAIPNLTDNSNWTSTSNGAYCIYDNNESNAYTYGYLYNWYALNDIKNIAPESWHVPTDDEWKMLEMALGMSQSEADDLEGIGWRGTNEGSKLAGNAELWYSGDLVNNSEFGSSGFMAIPGGYRNGNSSYGAMGDMAYLWTSTDSESGNAWTRNLNAPRSQLHRGNDNKHIGLSVRCLKDLQDVQLDYPDVDYQNDADSLIISWSGSDAASGVATYEYALGTTAGGIETVGWTEAGTATADTLTGLSLVEGTTYYLSVRATDLAGNVSDELSGDGILIDQTAPILGTVIDGMGADITYSGSDSTLASEWTGFSDPVSGMGGYEISAGYSPGDVAIYDWTPIGDVTSYTLTNIALSHGEICYVNIRAKDIAGNVSAPVSSNGVTIDTDPPGSIVDIEFDYYNEPGWTDDLQIQGSAADGEMQSGLNYVEVSIQNQDNTTYWTGSNWDGNETWLMASGLASWTYDLSGADLVDDNSYEIRSRGTDMVGNTQVDHGNDQFTYDISEPNTFLDIPDDFYNTDVWNADAPIQGTTEDETSEIVAVYVMIQRDSDDLYYDGENWTASELWFTAENTDTWSYELDGSNLDDDVSYAVQVKAEDIAGNVETSPATELFTFDITLPESDVLIERDFYNNINWSDANSISGTGSDSTSGLDSMAITIKRTSDNYWWGGTSWTTGESWLAPAGLETWTYAMNGNNLTNGVSYTVSSRSRDVASNVQVDYGEDSFIYDLTSPTLGQVNDGLASTDEDWTNSTTVLTANWAGFTDITSGILKYEYSAGTTPGSTDLISWTDAGLDTTFSEDVTMVSGTLYYISIRATDGAENVSGTVTSDGVTVDAANPVVSIINEGSTSQDMDYQQDGSALIISWDGSDGTRSFFRNGRDIGGFRVTLGSSSGDSNMVDWVDVGNVTTHTFSGLDLQEAVTYYASVQAEDLAGNLSEILTGDGITIDQSGPDPGILNDGVGDDVDWVYINYLIDGTWTGFEDSLSGIAEYEYSVGLSPGQTQTVTWTSAGLDTTITVSASLTEGATYFANVRATDNVTNVGGVISSDGFGLDVSAPITGNVYDGSGEDLTWTNITDSITGNWADFSDQYSGIEFYETAVGTSPGDQNTVSWFNADTAISATHNELNLEHGTAYYFSVRATDVVDNVSSSGISDGITIDTLHPVINLIAETASEDPLFQGSDSSIALFWGADDDLSGIEHFEFGLGSSIGATDIIDWTDAGTDQSVTITDLNFDEGSTYYGAIRVFDRAGNMTEAHGNGVIIDITAPETGSGIDITDLDNTSDQSFTGSLSALQASWSGFMDNLSGIDFYEYGVGSASLSTDIKDWTTVNLDTFMLDESFSLNNGDTYYISIRAIDSVGNVSAGISTDGIIADHEGPYGSMATDGDSADIDQQNYTDIFNGHWSEFQDDISGLAFHSMALYDTTNASYTIPWDSIGLDTVIQLMGLNLEVNHVYQLHIRATDFVENTGSIIASDGVLIDQTAPEAPVSLVGFFSNERIYLTWDPNSEADLSHYSVYGGTDTLQPLNILLTSETSAEAYLPEFPTDEPVYLHVTAEDIPGNESPVSIWVSGIPQPAMVTHIEPDPSIPLLKDDQQISIHFSQPLSDIGSITTTSLAYSSMGLDAAYSAEDTSIKITINDPWASLDTVMFALNNIMDWAETGTDEKTTTYTTYLLGDYNNDYSVDVADLSSFVSAWNSDDYSYELGPVTGTVPHFIPSRNQSFDLRDMMVFTRMWHYSHQTNTNRLLAYDPMGPELPIYQEGNRLIIDLPSETGAAHIYLNYPRESKTITPPAEINSEDMIQLAYHHDELGELVVEKAFLKKDGVKNAYFDLSSLDRSNALIEINYVAYDDSNRVIARGMQTINIIAIPDEFALHQNYPNPFNPTTRINYDVPEMGITDIRLYDLMGREVRTLMNRELAAGYHTLTWDGKNNKGQLVSAGIYFCQLRARGFTKTLKMMLLK